MNSLITLSKLAQFISPYRHFLVGFSGGLDSTVLLHRLMLLRNQQSDLKLRAIHIHHGLSPYANEWVSHCQLICKEWDIPLIVEYITLQGKGTNIEEKARKARYAVFASALLSNEKLVTAHNLNDQCETLLLALKRGSGPAGLSAMPDCTTFSGTKQQLRPMLDTSRASLEAWADEYDLCWVEDDSNQDINYDRNFLRLQVIPVIIRRWPSFANTVSRSARLCAEQESLLSELISNELSKAISEEGAIAIAALKDKSVIYRNVLLKRWLSTHQVVIPYHGILTRIWYEVVLAREDANPVLHLNSKFEIRRYQKMIWLVPRLPSIKDRVLFWQDLQEPLILPNGMGKILLQLGGQIRLPTEKERVTIRFQASGMLHIVGRKGGRKLKKIMQERNIPPWRRKTTPLLFYNEKLISALEVFITLEGFVESGVHFIWKT